MAVNPTAFYTPTVYGRVPVPAHKAVDKAVDKAEAVTRVKPAETKQADAKPQAAKKDENGFSFWDLVDIINPLQHIPLVNSVYRAVTGDKIKGFARVAGGAIFGGPIGAAMGGMNAIVAQETGSDIGELAMAKVGIGKKPATQDVQVADKKPLKDIPMVEVRPLAQHALKKDHVAIIWDQPVKIAQAVPVSSMPPEKELDALPDIKGMQKKEVKPELDKARIPDMMLSALQKYQEMQSMDVVGSIKPKT